MELAGARALVVGSSTGIGRALALALASAGADVTATVRPGRAGAAAPALRVVELDVADDAAVRRVVESIAPLDLVVYNAGYGVGGVLEEVDDATLAAQYEVNVFGLWRTVRASLPGMRARGRGAIVVIGSFGSRMPFPGIAAYRSSKAAVAAICGALHLEVAGFGIRVLHVQPGLVRSSFDANMVDGQGVDRRGPYAAVYDAAERAYPRMSPVAQSPDAVADRVVRELRLDDGPLEIAIGEDAERMLAWVAEGQEGFEEHLEHDLGYDVHRRRPDRA